MPEGSLSDRRSCLSPHAIVHFHSMEINEVRVESADANPIWISLMSLVYEVDRKVTFTIANAAARVRRSCKSQSRESDKCIRCRLSTAMSAAKIEARIVRRVNLAVEEKCAAIETWSNPAQTAYAAANQESCNLGSESVSRAQPHRNNSSDRQKVS